MKAGVLRLFLKVVLVWMKADSEDDTDWDIRIKSQLHLMSDALKQCRHGADEISNNYPYGKEWDFFSFGHCLEVYSKKILFL